MAGINAEMTPKELMDSFVPELISSKLAGVEFAPLQGTIQVDVLGAGQWVATIEGGRPSLKPGKAEAPWVTVVVSDAALRMGIGRAAGEIGDSASVKVSGLARQMADNLTQQIIDTIRAQVKGTIKFAVATADGAEEFVLLGFDSVNRDAPTCTVITSERELIEMAEAGLSPQEAFMGGKIRLEGDMAPVMTLAMSAMPLIQPGMAFLSKYVKRR